VKKAENRLKELKAKGKKAFIYGLKELGGLGTIYVLPGEIKDYNLPENPQVNAYLKEVEKLIKPYKDQGKLTATIVKTAWNHVKQKHNIA
jgi:hypothetical protein